MRNELETAVLVIASLAVCFVVIYLMSRAFAGFVVDSYFERIEARQKGSSRSYY